MGEERPVGGSGASRSIGSSYNAPRAQGRGIVLRGHVSKSSGRSFPGVGFDSPAPGYETALVEPVKGNILEGVSVLDGIQLFFDAVLGGLATILVAALAGALVGLFLAHARMEIDRQRRDRELNSQTH
jgi:hypothetical protein